jgi:hypothetical protein
MLGSFRNRRTILTLYDLLHLVALEGPRLRREVVVDYLARARAGASRRTSLETSRLRAFERAKQQLRALGAELAIETDPVEAESWLVFKNADALRARLINPLDHAA